MAGEVDEQYRIPVSELNALTALFADHISTSVPRMAPSPKQTKYNHMWISMEIEECVPTPPNNALTSFLHNGGEYTMYCPGGKQSHVPAVLPACDTEGSILSHNIYVTCVINGGTRWHGRVKQTLPEGENMHLFQCALTVF
jgi:hypothetical protein